MALVKTKARGISLTDNFDFTGTVTGTGSNIKEKLVMLCDGNNYTVSSGTYTSQNVTALQILTTSYEDVTGSTISYTPPSGSVCVIYEFCYTANIYNDASSISHFKFFIDSDEVVHQRMNLGGTTYQDLETIRCVIPIGGSADTNTGRLASWTSAKTLKLQARGYDTASEPKLHSSTYWDGNAGLNFHVPSLTITALG